MMRSNTRERRGVGLESKQTAQTRIHDVGQGKATIQRLGRDFLLPHNNKVIMTVMSPRGTITHPSGFRFKAPQILLKD